MRIVFPTYLVNRDYECTVCGVVQVFYEEEYLTIPVSRHDDSLDALPRIADDEVQAKLKRPVAEGRRTGCRTGGWRLFDQVIQI